MIQPNMLKAKGAGIRIQLAEWKGQGPPVLCLHGLTANCRCFDALAAALAPKRRVLAMDLRGRGLSDQPDTGYSIDHHCEDIRMVLDDLGIEKTALLGHSLGAYIALAFTHKHADRVDRLVLMDGGAQLSVEQWVKIGAGIKPSLDRLERTFPTLDAYLDNVKKAAYLDPWNDFIETYFRYECEEKEGVVRSRIRPEHIAEERKHLAATDTSAFYENVRCPVLVLRATEGMVAKDDHVVPDDAAAELKKALPQMELVSVQGSNHYSILFQPFEQRDNALRDFLRV